MYLPLRRSNLATLLTLFDFGDATTSTEIRSADERGSAGAVHDEQQIRRGAIAIAGGITVAERHADDRRRVGRAWFKVLGREPSREEVEASLRYIERFPARRPMTQVVCWRGRVCCRTLIASNDFHLRTLRTSYEDRHASVHPSRRYLLQRSACGFGLMGLAVAACASAAGGSLSGESAGAEAAAFPPRAKRVIFLFMHGVHRTWTRSIPSRA